MFTLQRRHLLKLYRTALPLLLLAVLPMSSFAQTPSNVSYTKNTIDLNKRSTIEVDPTTLALNIELSLAEFAGRGPGVPVALHYNSKVWRVTNTGVYEFPSSNPPHTGPPFYLTQALYSEHSTAGWTNTLSVPFIEDFGGNEAYAIWFRYVDHYIDNSFNNGEPTDEFYTRPGPESCDDHIECMSFPEGYTLTRMRIHMPDGSSHELRRVIDTANANTTEILVAVDGSHLRYDTVNGILYLPDGSRYLFTPTGVQFIDRNGNFLSYNVSNGEWTDTLGRIFTTPPVNYDTINSAGNYPWSLPGIATPSNYSFRWQKLADARSDPTQPLAYDGNQYFGGTPNGLQFQSPSLFTGGSTSGSSPNQAIMLGTPQERHDPLVLTEVVLPNGQKYLFSYNIYGEIDRVVMPTGGYKRYRYEAVQPNGLDPFSVYAQANRGVVEMWESVSGAVADEVHWQFGVSTTTGAVTTSGPIRADGTLDPGGTRTERTLQGINTGQPVHFGFHRGGGDALVGKPLEERTYDANGQMLRRTVNTWTSTTTASTAPWTIFRGQPIPDVGETSRDPRLIEQTEILFEPGSSSALTRTTAFDYDIDWNVITKATYDFVAVDSITAQTSMTLLRGTLLRTEATTYLVNDPNILEPVRNAYRARNLISLPTSRIIYQGSASDSNVVAQSSVAYDQGGLYAQLNDYGTVSNWTNPGADVVRGNPTTTSDWLNFDGSTFNTFHNGTESVLTMHAQYDQCGSVRKRWDGNGKSSEISYADRFTDTDPNAPRNTYAYPTSTKTAVPDPDGTYGSRVALETSSVYDFSTGKVISSTNVNGKTTRFNYTEPLNRLKMVTRPDGSTTTYNYSDAPLDLYVELLTKQDETRDVLTRQYFDGYGRAVRSFIYDGTPNTPWIVTDTYSDNRGRTAKISNPYRVSNPSAALPEVCSVCRTMTYDALSRITVTTTPDNAKVTSDYGVTSLGTTVTVTDQAGNAGQPGRNRRSVTDSLGRLIRIDEPGCPTSLPCTAGLGAPDTPVQPTSYTYDILGNLKRVDQPGQHRYFLYDSLSRLIRTRHPEQGVSSANDCVDPAGDPDHPNSQWSMAYTYDANGNLTRRTDARGVVSDYVYDGINRNTTITYSSEPQDQAPTPGVHRYYDAWRDGQDNSLPPKSVLNAKGRLWQTETAGTSGMLVTFDGYDLVGHPTRQQQQFKNGGVWSQAYVVATAYDLGGNLKSETYPSLHTITYNYDLAGRLGDLSQAPQDLAVFGNLGDGVSRTYASGLAYDAASHLTQEKFGTDTAIYNKVVYNVRGQLAEILESTVPNDPSWDRGKIVNDYSLQCTGAGCNAPDNNGNLRRQTVSVPGSSSWYQTYEYDALNRLTQVNESTGQSPLDWQQWYNYDVLGNRTIDLNNTSLNIPRKEFEVETSTNRLLAPGDLAFPGAGNINQRKMRYDNAGNLVNDNWSSYGSSDAGVASRTYDAENRMTSALDNAGGTTHYYYDADGRRVRRAISGQPEVWQIYGMSGGLLAEYPANGPTSAPQKEYGYRNGQLLVTVTAGNGWGIAPTLHDNPLVVAQSTIQSRHMTELREAINALRAHLGMSAYVWVTLVSTSDPISVNPLVEMRSALDQALGAPAGGYAAGLSQGQSIKAVHVQELRDRVLTAWSTGSSAEISWLVSDHLGTPRMIFDKTGSLAGMKRHDYLPFGEELATQGLRNTTPGYGGSDNVRQKFTEKERDIETGLDYFGARYYSSAQGRFTSIDPILISTARTHDPQRLNLYNHSRNNPLKYIDVDGREIVLANKRAHERARANIDVALTEAERQNVQIVGDRVVLVNPQAISFSDASPAYVFLWMAIVLPGTHRNFALAPGESATATHPDGIPGHPGGVFTYQGVRDGNGQTVAYDNGDTDSFVPVANDMTTEGENGDKIAVPEWRSWWHEEIGHGLGGLADFDFAVSFENAVAESLGFPARSYRSHDPWDGSQPQVVNTTGSTETPLTTDPGVPVQPPVMRPLIPLLKPGEH